VTVPPRLTVSLPTYSAEDPGGWDHLFDLATAAEAAGVDRVVVSDHVVFGEHLDAYGRPESGGVDGGRQPTGPDGHWLEPLTVLTAIAARTTTVRLGTHVLLAALRRPAVLAKQAASIDVLSKGRLDLGVGIGWQREEYEATGLDYGERGRTLDHTLEVCQLLWREQRASYTSPELTFDGIHAMPKPVQPGGVPVWVSGRCNERVARRTARFAHGWIPWAEDAADPVASIPRMRAAVERAGGDGASLAVLVPLPAMERLPEFVEAGVTDVLSYARPPRSYEGALDTYSELVGSFRSAGGGPS
jgi:probable F420-dependent oxidoreductase